MAIFKNTPVNIGFPIGKVYAKISNPEELKNSIPEISKAQIPEDKLKMLENIKVTPESIEISGGPVGSLKFVVLEREDPTLVKLRGEGTPVAMTLCVRLAPVNQDSCTAEVEIDIALPKLMLPMVSGPIQQMADQFGILLKALPYG